MGPDELEWVDISDFSPGHFEPLNRRDSSIKAAPGPDGAADTTETFGCISDHTGGLIGAPRWTKVWVMNASLVDNPDASENNYRANSAPAPTNAPLADMRLVDFDIINAEEKFGAAKPPGPPTLVTRTTDLISDERNQTLLVGAVWEAFGTDSTTGTITHASAQARTSGLQYRGTQIKCFHGAYDAGLSTLRGSFPSVSWRVGTATSWFDGQTIHPSQKLYGRGMIQAGRVNRAEGSWKYGDISFVFNFVNFGDIPVSYFGYTGPAQNGVWLPVYNGQGLGIIGSENLGTGLADTGSPGNNTKIRVHAPWGDAVTHYFVFHAGRLVVIAAPNWWATTGSFSSSTPNPYKDDYAIEGRTTWDALAQVGTIDNLQLHWTQDLNTLIAESGTGSNNAGLQLPMSRYTQLNAMVSVHASKLFIISSSAGAVLVEGDMNSSNVTSMPSVESTYGLTPHPVVVNGGVVYGSKSGIFMWTGEDSSQLLSPQLHGKFWVPNGMDENEDYEIATPRGRMAYRWPWLLCPNGWAYNMQTNGWWRFGALDATGSVEHMTHWRIDNQGHVWATKHVHDGTSAYDLTSTGEMRSLDTASLSASVTNWPLCRMDLDSERTRWQWQSQPISVSRNRTVEIRELAVTLQTSTTTAYVYFAVVSEGQILWSQLLDPNEDWTNGYPRTVVMYPAVTGQNLQIRAHYAAIDDEPMKIHRISYGWRSAERIRQAGSEA